MVPSALFLETSFLARGSRETERLRQDVEDLEVTIFNHTTFAPGFVSFGENKKKTSPWSKVRQYVHLRRRLERRLPSLEDAITMRINCKK